MSSPALQAGSRKPGTFQPGDSRINRKGQISPMVKLRTDVQKFLESGRVELPDGAKVNRLNAVLRTAVKFACEGDAAFARMLLEYGYGKPVQALSGPDGEGLFTGIAEAVQRANGELGKDDKEGG